MERNCQHYVKVEKKGATVVYWRCLNDHTTTKKADGKTIYVCEEHKGN